MKPTVFTLTIVAMLVGTLSADNWPEWRGPNANGFLSDGGYPVEWSEDHNILWKIPTPGWGTSTPVIWDDTIYITAAEDNGNNQLIALDPEGKQRWIARFGPSIQAKNRKAGGANPSPVTDGQLIYAYFKNGDLACVDRSGSVVWQKNLQQVYGPDQLNWDLGTSPVLTARAVVIAVMHQGPSYLAAFDRATGAELWKSARDLGAPAESRDSYSTPVVVRSGDQELLVVLGADFVTGVDAGSGREVWRVGGLNPAGRQNFRSIASPAIDGDLVFAPYARGESLTAIRLGGSGDVTSSHVAWTVPSPSADVPTPVAVNGKVYICSDRGVLSCVEGSSGDVLWSLDLPRGRQNYSASPVIAGDKLYATREDGTTFVVQLGERPERIAENTLREFTYATPAFVNGRIYLRTSDWLFCIGMP